MPIPGYESMMLPILELAADGAVHRAIEATELIVSRFGITEAERAEVLPSGTAKTLTNRVHWALTYLRHAEVIRAEGRGQFAITDRGRQLLAERPNHIDRALLTRYPEFLAFVGGGEPQRQPAAAASPQSTTPEPTLEETLDEVHAALKRQFEHALPDQIKASSSEFFERMVIDVLVRVGYGGSRQDAAQHLGRTGDGGVDGVINEDRLGLESIYVQAKKWAGAVGRPDVQGFVGSLEGHHARKGVFITTATFSAEARQYVAAIEKKIVLVDGPLLVRLMLEFGVGVRTDQNYPTYSIDESYFATEEQSVL